MDSNGIQDNRKVAIYCRVSTDEQSNKSQLQAVNEYIDSKGFKEGEIEIYIDSISGLTDVRENLDKMMERVRGGYIKEVIIWCFSRLARSVSHMCGLLKEFEIHKVTLTSIIERIDTSGVMGQCIVKVLTAFSEMEVQLIRERTKAGLINARLRGRHPGRPKGRKDRKRRDYRPYVLAQCKRRERQLLNEKRGVLASA